MATVTREPMDTTLIPNTTMEKVFINGVHKQYTISPNEDYVLHDNAADGFDLETETVIPRFSTGTCSCGVNYDFSTTTLEVVDVNGNVVSVIAYGNREFYVFPRNLVPNPENNIYGDEPEHEVMGVENENIAE